MRCLPLFIMMIVLHTAAMAQSDTSCNKFRNGKFVYNDSANRSKVITRTKNKQEDRDTRTGIVIRSKIRWTGDCTYELIQVWSNDKARRKFNRSVTVVNITKLYDNGYEYSCNCADKSITGSLVKL